MDKKNPLTVNKSTLAAMKNIKSADPKYAKHMLQKNDILEDFAFSIFGGVDILEQPVCRKCERPALWDHGDVGHCMACGTITKNPWTVRQYLLDQIDRRKLTQEQLEVLSMKGRQFADDSEEK